MKRLAIALLSLSLWLSLPVLAPAQPGRAKSTAPTGYKLMALMAKGTSRYTDKEILAATGLQLGQNAADGDFKEAAQRLGESGLFTEVVYSFSPAGSGVKLEMHLTDADKSKLLPARFENFVWFTDSELRDSIQSSVPLFKDLLPSGGRLAEEVSETLQAMLNAKHIPGRVSFLHESPQEGGDLTAIVYRVEEVSIRIRNVEIPGASPDQTALLTKAAHHLSDAEYSRSALAAVAKFDLLPLYLQRGYLKAVFAPADARVVTDPQSEDHTQNEIQVDAAIPVTPGEQYSVSGVTWKGNAAVSTEEASHVLHLVPGQPADAVGLVHDVETLVKLYHSRGYMTAQVEPDAQFDDGKGEVHYALNVTEGDLYHMGELEILGLDAQSQARLMEAWKLREGQPYDPEYTRTFLQNTAHLLPKGAQFSIRISEMLEPKQKLVDLTIHFKMQ